MSQSLSTQRALASYRDQLSRNAEARRLARKTRIRRYFERDLFVVRGGWLFAAMSIGTAVGILVARFAS